jgi:HlyD family secretion protein
LPAECVSSASDRRRDAPADPNRSGVVQSSLQGRYQAPHGGVPALGTRVKAGDLLGRVAPSFASIDASDMAQTSAASNRRLLLCATSLPAGTAAQKHVVATATVEDTRTQLAGLEKRRSELLAAKNWPEDLHAPVDGVIAAKRVVPGQVIAQSNQLFQIVDPASLLGEALAFEQIGADAVEEALASVGADAVIKLKVHGPQPRSPATLFHPAIQDPGDARPLDVGTLCGGRDHEGASQRHHSTEFGRSPGAEWPNHLSSAIRSRKCSSRAQCAPHWPGSLRRRHFGTNGWPQPADDQQRGGRTRRC